MGAGLGGRGGDEVGLRLQRAELLRGLQRLDEAASDYERVVALEPGHQGSLTALSQLYRELGRGQALERVQRALLAADPLNPSAYRALAEAWRGEDAEAYGQSVQVLSLLQVAQGEEELLAESWVSEPPQLKGPMSEAEFLEGVVHPSCQTPLLQLLRHVGGVLVRLLPDDLKAHGIGWRTPRLPLWGEAFAEHGLVGQVARLLGVEDVDVYWLPDAKRPEPGVGHGKSPALILGPEVFREQGEAQARFALGRALGPLRLGLEVFRALPLEELRRVVWSTLKGLDTTRTFPGDDARSSRAVAKAISRLEVPRVVQTLGRQLWRDREELDLEAFQQGVALTAVRCGVLAAGGPLAAARGIAHSNLALRGQLPSSPEAAASVFGRSPELSDLISYAVSPAYLTLRRRVIQ